MNWACGTYGRQECAYRVWVAGRGGGVIGGKNSPGRPKRRWEENIKMNLQELECGNWLDCSGSG